jgi:hypothetical protein
MNLVNLFLALGKASPEIRFFTILFLREFNSGVEYTNKTILELSNDMGVTKQLVQDGVAYLLKKRLLTFEKVGYGVNSYKRHYFLTTEAYELMQGDENFLGHSHKNVINSLLSKAWRDEKGKKLRISNRLLLIAMLFKADETGVVSSLGRAELRELTGLKKDGLTSQIKKLLDNGYIRFYVSGITHKLLFGAAAGVYFLNLAKLQHNGSSGGIIIQLPECLSANELITNTIRGLNRYPLYGHKLITKKVIDLEAANKGKAVMQEIFKQNGAPRLHQYMASKINRHASYLLSYFWKELSEEATNYHEELINEIDEDLTLNTSASSSPRSNKESAIVQWISIMVVDLATTIMTNMSLQKKSSLISFKDMNYSILPDNHYANRIAIEAHPKGNEESLKGWALIKPSRNRELLVFSKENLSSEENFSYLSQEKSVTS